MSEIPAGPMGWDRLLGIEYLETTATRVRARVAIGPQHHQPYGIVHGGVYCSIVEAVASYGAGAAALARGQRGIVGVANSTDFLRSNSEGVLIAEAEPVHVGRNMHLWGVAIRREADGTLVARGQVRFHVLDQLPAERMRDPGAVPKPR